jgi:hypothetical protein
VKNNYKGQKRGVQQFDLPAYRQVGLSEKTCKATCQLAGKLTCPCQITADSVMQDICKFFTLPVPDTGTDVKLTWATLLPSLGNEIASDGRTDSVSGRRTFFLQLFHPTTTNLKFSFHLVTQAPTPVLCFSLLNQSPTFFSSLCCARAPPSSFFSFAFSSSVSQHTSLVQIPLHSQLSVNNFLLSLLSIGEAYVAFR